MCLIGLAIGASQRFPLIVAANRDELHARPTRAAHWWDDEPRILAGRDQLAGGTWLGVTKSGSVSAVTNLHEPWSGERASSRGSLVTGFLADSTTPSQYAAKVVASCGEYRPFNLLLIDDSEFYYVNSEGASVELPTGVHAFSNSPIGETWPKTERARRMLLSASTQRDPAGALLDFLSSGAADTPTVDFTDDVFVRGNSFGTRSSTVILISADRRLELIERQYDASGQLSNQTHISEALEP